MFGRRFHSLRKRVWSWLFNHWPVVVLAILSSVLFLTNYFPGTYLVGWDNTIPELSLGLNFKRFLFGVWQDYRGLGTLDGMAHTANMVYWMYTAILSLFLPTNVIRYVTQLGCHFLGGVGVYFLSRYLNHRLFPQAKLITQQCVSLGAALLYMLNLMTIQMFYIPLELFSLHFVALPWIFLTLLMFFEKPSRRTFFIFILICFLVASQAHVPTLFIVTSIAVGVLLLTYLLSPFSFKRLRTVLLVGVGFVCINAWWAFPYAYSALVKPAEIGQSRVNLFSTNDIFYRNQAFGDLNSVLRFGSFNVDYLDWETKTLEFIPLLKTWQDHYAAGPIMAINTFLSVTGLAGLVLLILFGLRKKKSLISAIGVVGLFAFCMLATDTPGVSLVSYFLREKVPLFREVFRFTFTKFSFLYVCCLSVGFGSMLLWILQPIARLNRHIVLAGIFGALGGAFLFISVPAFQGNFFYPELRQKIPQDYFLLQKYFQIQPENTRIAVFPLHGFYGWTTNSWGHRGSGFLWQMLPQPMLDRAFDAWSKDNETFYYQVRTAVISDDPEALKRILQKYRVQWILFDQTLFQPGERLEALRLVELPGLFARANITEAARFGQLIVYKANDLNLDPFSAHSTSIAKPYTSSYALADQAYGDYSQYTVGDKGIEYPFSFFQAEALKNNQPFSVKENDFILPFNVSANQKVEPSRFADQEKSAVVDIYTQQKESSLLVRFVPQLPTIEGESSPESPPALETEIPITTKDSSYFLVVDNHVFTVQPTTELALLSRTILPIKKDFSINVYQGTPTESENMLQDYRRVPVRDCWKDISKMWKVGEDQGDTVALYSFNASACVSLNISGDSSTKLANTEKQLLIVETTSVSPTDNIPAHCVHQKEDFQCLNDVLRSDRDSSGKTTLQTYAELSPNTAYGLDIINRVREQDKEEKVDFRTIDFKTYTLIQDSSVSLAARAEESSTQLSQRLERLPAGDYKLRVPSLSLPFILPRMDQSSPISQRFERVPYLNCDRQKRGEIFRTESNQLTYTATQKAALCESFRLSGLPNEAEYLYYIKGNSENGSGLRGNIFNPADSTQELEFTSGVGKFEIWSPLEISKSITEIDEPLRAHFTVQSYGREKNTITLQKAALYPFPLDWLQRVKIVPAQIPTTESKGSLKVVQKVGNFFYSVSSDFSQTSLVTLPQSFESGWIGLTQQGAQWQLMTQHQPASGWSNSWMVPNGKRQIYFIYLPQVVSFLGWVLTGSMLLAGVVSTVTARRKKYSHSHEASSETVHKGSH